ncbi:MAG: hypothetical protein K1X74_01025 [Pirellulales bacterium]|nr:hypothetical protein [Pirellulales bacterium]
MRRIISSVYLVLLIAIALAVRADAADKDTEAALAAVAAAPETQTVRIGDKAPRTIGGVMCHGSKVDTADFGGKYVLVVYWSESDPNYKAWDATLREIRRSYTNNTDFLMLSICMDGDFAKWKDDLEQAKPIELKGKQIALFRDRIWWHAVDDDWPVPQSVVDREHLPVAHLIGRDLHFLAVRIPLDELNTTVESQVKPVE